MFEWLFSYPLASWQEATFGFASKWPLWALGLAIAVALLITAAALLNQHLSAGKKIALLALQSVVATILITMLWQPVLRMDVAEQGENTVAWLVDISGSMQTEDVSVGGPSGGNMQRRVDAAGNILSSIALDRSAEFDAALYVVGDSLDSINSTQQLNDTPPSATTDIAGGLDALLGTVGESALAAVVLVSDGSDNADAIDAQWWQRLSAAGVPVHSVGIGSLARENDIQLSDVTLPAQAAANVQLTAQLKIAHDSAGSARIRVLAGRDLIAAQTIELPDGVNESVHEVSLPSGDSGIRQLRFEVVSNEQGSDPDLANNVQPRILRVDDSPQRILYVEGEPRWEYKFLRRALDEHPGVEVVSLLRTSPNKFYRQGVRDATELANGFPVTREELFGYDAIILGSLEAAELSNDQQLALRDFVSVRGGSLLMLAGRHGLADGGWGRSVLAAALPVVLDARLSAQTFERVRYRAFPTVSGYRTPWLSLAATADANASAWQGLPELADAQSVGRVKPGAVVLLERVSTRLGEAHSQPLLVSQRYGKGHSVVLGTSGTWRWQMGLDSSDQRHETFWKQIASMLIEGVVPRISVLSTKPVYRDSSTALLTVSAYAADYQPLQQATLPVQITMPDGAVRSVELQSDTRQPGRFSAVLDTPLDGPYTMNAMTPLGGESPQSMLASSEHWWVRESGTAESFDNVQQQDFLQRIADATGGSYLSLDQADSLIDVLTQKNAALKRQIDVPLWSMPVLFLCLLIAKSLEWLLRLRWKRL